MSDPSESQGPGPNPPIDYAVAVWVGMPHEQILTGLREGWIRRPPGMSADWLPAEQLDGQPSDGIPDPVPTRDLVHSWLSRLDPTLDTQTFDRIWGESGATDAMRAATLTTFLRRTLGIDDGIHGAEDANHGAIEHALDAMHGTAKLVRLEGRTGAELEALALEHGGMRRALAEHSPWAVIDNRALSRRADPEGRFDRFDADTGEANLSDAWIGDRARYAAWRRAHVDSSPRAIEGDGWRFIDRAVGPSATVELKGATDIVHQVIFARDDGDRVSGGVTTDRIHGGHGDDILRGRAGDDLLDGGRGDDVLHGGSGRDDLAGRQGHDEIDGGAGTDRLDGGSGNDELIGGRGDDLLRGGSGDDVYRFESGDGIDTIEDTDGSIVLDDVAIVGTMQRQGGSEWRSETGNVTLTLEGQGAGAALILRTAEGGDAIRLQGWSQGAFGITLNGLEASESDGDEQPAVEGPGENGTLDNAQQTVELVEGSGGAVCGEAGTEAPCRSDATPTQPEVQPDVELAALAPDPLAAVTLIDAASLTQAFESWGVPLPPDIVATSGADAGAVTASDIVDAIAENVGDEVDAEATSTALDSGWWSELPMLRDPSPMPLPPDALLRRTP